MKVSASASRLGLLAALVARPGSTQINIRPLELPLDTSASEPASEQAPEQDLNLTSTIDFLAGEVVQSYRWLTLANPEHTSQSKKRKNEANTSSNLNSTPKYIDYLVILLETGEILIYSTLTKEFINKISTDSPFSAIDVISEPELNHTYDYDIVTFHQQSSSLKFFSSSSPRLVKSVPFKKDASIQCILFNAAPELILASATSLYVLDSNHKIVSTIDIKSDESQGNVSKIALHGSNSSTAYITREDCKTIQVVDLAQNTVSQTLVAATTVNDFTLIKAGKATVLAATLINGSIELFNITDVKTKSEESYAQLDIKGGAEVGKFVTFLNSTSVIVDQVFKSVWYDNFKIKITDFEFDDITALQSTVKINVNTPDDEVFELGEDEELELEQEQEQQNEQQDQLIQETEQDNEVHDYTCEDLASLSSIVKPRLQSRLDMEAPDCMDATFILSLACNVSFAKSFIHTLTVSESNNLLSKCAYAVTHLDATSTSTTSSKEFQTIHNIKEWIKWTLILRGSVVTMDEDCLGWLKLLHSELRQDAKLLPNLVKLTGKLALLKDQLQMRSEMMNSGLGDASVSDNDHDDHYDDDDADADALNGSVNGTSVVLDGEGGYDDDDDDNDDDEVIVDAEDADSE